MTSSPPPPKRPGKAEVRVRVSLSAVSAADDVVEIPVDELKTLLTLVNYADGSALSGWTIEYGALAVSSTKAVQEIDFWITGGNPCDPEAYAAASILPPGAAKPIQTRPGPGHTFDSNVRLPSSVNPLWQVTTLKLAKVSSSDKVYVNGLAQIKVKIEYAITDLITHKPAELTAAELKSLTIGFYDGMDALPIDIGPKWVTSLGVDEDYNAKYYKGYLPYPDGSKRDAGERIEPPPSPQASRFCYFYVACYGNLYESVTLCARVQCRDGWIYASNGTSIDPCGAEHDSGFESSLPIYGVKPEVGKISQFPWVRDVLVGDDHGIEAHGKGVNPESTVGGDEGGTRKPRVTNPVSVHRYTLSFIDKWGNEVGIRFVELEPKGMIQWHDKGTGDFRACFTGYAVPDSKELLWNTAVPVGDTPLPTLPSSEETKAAIVLVGRQDILYQDGKPNGPCTVKATDSYGNTTTLHVKFAGTIGDGRWELVLY
nr:hypothetical protein [Luteibacter rhizovicinus]